MKKMLKVIMATSLLATSLLNVPTIAAADATITTTVFDGPRAATSDKPLTYFRIPALTTTNKGTMIAVTDARYNKPDDIGIRGPQQVDLLIKSSEDDGQTWVNETNLTEEFSTFNYGYGDAAIVADRDSDKVLIVNVAGTVSFWDSKKNNKMLITTLTSEDGGKNFNDPVDITNQIYNLNDSWVSLFAASGRIMQSRYVKEGEHYRLYMAILTRAEEGKRTISGNYVLYSDDFGKNWKVLGDRQSPVPAGDEAKLEELPNGNVVISSRETASRYFNIFSYNENDYTSGSWESSPQELKYSTQGQDTNGELLVVYAKEKQTGEYKHLVLQTLPTGKGRSEVKIFYKPIDENVSTVDQFISDWNIDENFYLLQSGGSAYSTLTIQKDGSIGALYETSWDNDGYDIVYKKLDIETITGGKYETAFTGIGSKDTPYVVTTETQLDARQSVFANERVYWSVYKDLQNKLDTSDVVAREGRIAVQFGKRPTETSVKNLANYSLNGQPLPENTTISYTGDKKTVYLTLPANQLANYTGDLALSTRNIVAQSDASVSLDVTGTVNVNATATDLETDIFYIDRNTQFNNYISVNYTTTVADSSTILDLNHYTLDGKPLPAGTTIRLQGNGTQAMIRLPESAMATLGNNVELIVKQSAAEGLTSDYTAILDFNEVLQ